MIKKDLAMLAQHIYPGKLSPANGTLIHSLLLVHLKYVLRSSVRNSPSFEALPRLPPPCSSKGPFPPVGAIPGGLQVHI